MYCVWFDHRGAVPLGECLSFQMQYLSSKLPPTQSTNNSWTKTHWGKAITDLHRPSPTITDLKAAITSAGENPASAHFFVSCGQQICVSETTLWRPGHLFSTSSTLKNRPYHRMYCVSFDHREKLWYVADFSKRFYDILFCYDVWLSYFYSYNFLVCFVFSVYC